MPIDYKKYPKNWKAEIRPQILQRDVNCCKFCRVANGSVIHRFVDGNGCAYYSFCSIIYSADNGDVARNVQFTPNDAKCVKIVLTIAHLDHDIANNDYSNLAALCQRCHLRYDAKQHAETRRRNRQLKNC